MKGHLFRVGVGGFGVKYVFADNVADAIQRVMVSVERERTHHSTNPFGVAEILATHLCPADEVLTDD